MKRQPENSTFPIIGDHHQSLGLTRREYFAALAMQSFILHPQLQCTDVSDISKFSVNMADALINELNKEEK